MDLADLCKPTTIEVPGVAELTLPLQTGDLYEWVSAGEKAKRWADGREMVELMLREQAGLTDAIVSALLSPPHLDQVAIAIEMAALGAVQLNEDDACPEAVNRLRNRLAARSDAYVARSRKLAERAMKRNQDAINAARRVRAAFPRGLSDLIDAERRFAASGIAHAVRQVTGASLGSDAISERMKQVGSADSALASLGLSTNAMSERMKQLGAVGTALDTLSASSSALAERISSAQTARAAVGLSATQHVGIAVGASKYDAISAGLAGIADRTDFASSLQRLNGVGATIAEQFTASSLAAGLMSNNDLFARLSAQPTIDFSGLAGASAMAKALRDQFDFRMPPFSFGSAGLAAAVGAMSLASFDLIDNPGFQTTVAAGTQGLAPRGVAADVLHSYGLGPIDEAPVFSEVVSGITSLDFEGEERSDRLVASVAVLTEQVRLLLSRDSRPITLTAVINMLGALAGIVSLGFSYLEHQANEADRRKPQNAEVVAKLEEINRSLPRPQFGPDHRFIHGKAWLRAQPNAQGQKLLLIQSDQPVRVIEATDSWAKVEVYNYRSAIIVGWVSRRLLHVQPY